MSKQNWLITGASGFIGRRITADLLAAGHRVCGLSRQNRKALPNSGVEWIGTIAECPLTPSHVLNLAGEPIADRRWTERRKAALYASRIGVTQTLSNWLSKQDTPPEVIIQGSAVGYYGISAQAKTEADSCGHGFSAELCRDWEHALAAPAGSRVVYLRIGVVLGAGGGMLKKLLPLFRLGLGGAIGHGQQTLSWISLDDLVSLIHYATDNPEIQGALNATAPNPMNSEHFAKHLGKALHRPAILRTPAWVMKTAFGDMAEELLLSGQTVLPEKALAHGFSFQHPSMCQALSAALQMPPLKS